MSQIKQYYNLLYKKVNCQVMLRGKGWERDRIVLTGVQNIRIRRRRGIKFKNYNEEWNVVLLFIYTLVDDKSRIEWRKRKGRVWWGWRKRSEWLLCYFGIVRLTSIRQFCSRSLRGWWIEWRATSSIIISAASVAGKQ